MEFDGTEYNKKYFSDRKNYSVSIKIPPLLKGQCNPKCPLYEMNSLFIAHCALNLAEGPLEKMFPGKECPRYKK